MPQHDISLAPIQGITDFHFRNTFAKYFTCVDRYFAPYLHLTAKGALTAKLMRDVDAKNNAGLHLVPQIMANRITDFIFMANYLHNQGYTEVNWNMGCPYPMVTNRGLGAGLLEKPEQVKQILDEVLPNIKPKLSIKLRSGLYNEAALPHMLELFNNYPVNEVIIHPRYAKQLYKGIANRELFAKCAPISKHPVCYNGDISSLTDWLSLAESLPQINRWMIARALIANPFLAMQIKAGSNELGFNLKTHFADFHAELLEGYLKLSEGGDKQVVMKMLGFWEYFALSFSNSDKVYKKIKKAKSMQAYRGAVHEIFGGEDWVFYTNNTISVE